MNAVKRNDKTVVSDAVFKHTCVACKKSFQYNCLLKLHIRKHHYKRVGFVPYADTQNINDVWVEKVENSDALVEIKKVGTNELLIQKVKDDTIQPTDIRRQVIDVRKSYPLCTDFKIMCRVCQKNFKKRSICKHFATQHKRLVKKRCEACDTTFKRLYNCATHVCPFNSIK